MVFLTIIIFLTAVAVVAYGLFVTICGLISDVSYLMGSAFSDEKPSGGEVAKHVGLLFVDILGVTAVILGACKMFGVF